MRAASGARFSATKLIRAHDRNASGAEERLAPDNWAGHSQTIMARRAM